MTPSRWQQIEELYHAALECESGERPAFLARADPDLRGEVESLLAQGATPLDHPAWDGAASLLGSTVAVLTPGTQLGPYKIEGPLAAGGMGEVFRGVDTRLGRPVAVKTSREQFSARFDREARAISSLNHPNICTLYDVGPNYLVMELCEGETLAARLKRGKLSIQETLRYGAQIADALAAAHAKGITHRDLKPGNIMISKSAVKVLDFGLAKSPQDLTLTDTRMVMGTPAYMAPEQREGKDCDARTDIYALGLILSEMATGKRAEQGQAPPLDTLPAQLGHVIERCIAHDPDDRWHSARDLQRELQWAATATAPLEGASQRGSAPRPWLPWTVTAVATLCLASISFLHFREQLPAETIAELALSIVPPSGLLLAPVGGLNVDRISPDGSTVLYRATDNRFHLRRLSSFSDQLMPPLEWYGDPFWAPDSKSIAFPTVSAIMKMQVPNGAPELVTAPFPERGGSWGEKGVILFAGLDTSPGSIGLYSVPVAGGKALPIKVPGLKEGRYYNPQFLPGGEDFLFVFSPSDSAGTQLYIATMHDGKAVDPRLLFSNDTSAAFTSAGGGHILFVRNDNLYAQKFDVRGRQLIGDPELVQERVASNPAYRNAYFSVSNTGTVVWRSGTAVTSQVTIFDRKGNRIGTAGAAVPASVISLAPDEAHVLVSDEAGSWIMESNGPGRTSLVWSALPRFWSPDGSGIIGRRGTEIVQRSIIDSREIRPFPGLPALGNGLSVHGISADGRRILYSDGTSLLSFSLDGQPGSEHVVDQRVDNAAMSPDGAWTVYRPRLESGIYVQPLTSVGLRKQIANSGTYAVWRNDGKEIVYDDQGRIWSVRVDGAGAQLRFAPPELLFSVASPFGMLSGARPLAVSRDGSKIYFLQSAEQPDSGVIHVRTRAIR